MRVDFKDWSQRYCGAKTLDGAKDYVASKKDVEKATYFMSEADFKIVA